MLVSDFSKLLELHPWPPLPLPVQRTLDVRSTLELGGWQLAKAATAAPQAPGLGPGKTETKDG